MVAHLYRHVYERYTLPLGHLCLRLGLTPNLLTVLSLIASSIAGLLFATGRYWLGLVFVLLMALGDMMDGATARAGGTTNRFGGVLDHVSDRYAEFLLLFGILLSGRVMPAWPFFAISGMIMASYVRAKAESLGGLRQCTVGLAGRNEKLTLFVAGLIADLLWPHLHLLMWALIAIGVLSHITAGQRLLYTYQELARKERPTADNNV